MKLHKEALDTKRQLLKKKVSEKDIEAHLKRKFPECFKEADKN